jgi:hypothetical protein
MLNVNYAECHVSWCCKLILYAKSRYAECHYA